MKSEIDTRENILKISQQEFLEKGYNGAWLRDIAKKAGVTTGALYGYFKSKEELFGALVDDAYYGIQNLYKSILNEFAELPPEKQQTYMGEESMKGMFKMVDYIYNNFDAFKLILCCSEGTKYIDLARKMGTLNDKATEDFVATNESMGGKVKRINSRLQDVMTVGLFTMLFEVVVNDIPRDEANEYIIQLMNFFIGGYSKIMGI